MPGFDRTGPTGAGPGTGWRQGRCFGFGSRGPGRPRGGITRGPMAGLCRRFGLGPGAGFGRGRRGALPAGSEKDALLEEKSWLEEKLRAIERRLSSFGS